MAYLFEEWDAIELFCRLVSKKHRIPLKDFQNNAVLNHWLKEYKSKEKSASLSVEVTNRYKQKPALEEKSYKTGQKLKEHVRFIYDLCSDIRYSRPVVIEDFPFNASLAYIGDRNYKSQYRMHLTSFIANNKQRLLEGTNWILYFYDELSISEGNTTKFYKGVSRAIIELKPFAKVELTRHKKGSTDKRVYSGSFKLIGNDKYLALKMRLKKSNERDLRMVFYIGSDEFELATGIAANVSDSLWARTCLLEPFNKSTKEANELGFFSKELENINNKYVPDHVWDYLEMEGLGKIQPPDTITTIAKFWAWKNKQ